MIQSLLLVEELVGAFLILLGFWANATRRWSQHSVPYLWVNLLGSVLLGISAVINHRPGFVILEIAWFYISLSGLLRRTPTREE